VRAKGGKEGGVAASGREGGCMGDKERMVCT